MAPSADPINPQHGPSFEPFNRGGPTTMNGINGVNGGSHDHAHGPATPANGSKRVDSPGRGRSQSAAESGPVRADKDHRTDDRSEHAHSTRKRGASGPVKKTLSHDNVQRLSAAEMQELTSSPDSLPIAPAPQPLSIEQQDLGSPSLEMRLDFRQHARQLYPDGDATANGVPVESRAGRGYWKFDDSARRPLHAPRTVSTPPTTRIQPADGTPYSSSPRRFSFNPSPRPPPLSLNGDGPNGFLAAHMPPPAIQSASPSLASQQPAPAPSPARGSRPPSPIPAMIPLPPMSLPTHLQLELAAQRPSPLYIHHSHSNDIPYESSSEKFERLKNVLLLPPYLERVLNFGALACLDAWLYTFTILPVRFIMALTILIRWWGYVVGKETMWLVGYVWYGLGRLWRRGRHDQSRRPSNASEGDRSRSRSRVRELHVDTDTKTPNPRERSLQTRRELHADGASETLKSPVPTRDPGPKTGAFRHRRTKSTPSSLSAFHKADLLQGAVIICSSLALMTLDASRMYHFIRAQSAIKLYVIYNILEVGDRLLSALGQDILECLFSSETLSRNASGRSKVLLPLGMFMLALAYNCLHSIALYYQVITLNVAVNSYSNALLTLLLSNQFVEIKSTVFKRFEKDNLFQLTCADIVERFHLWIMLLIIGMRNVVEVGGLSVPGAGLDSTYDDAGPVPLHPPSILPHSFTVLPSWLMSGEVLSPFLIVVGSEMLVDSIKHAYVTKFNNIKPTFYSRTLDILCKDYYTNAFVTPSLTRRLGLAVIPLSCLFIRASIQTYHMFLSTHIPMPLPQSTQTSLTEESATPSSPAMMAALNRFDSLIRDSLGRATYGYPYGSPLNSRSWYSWTSDDFIAALTMVVVFFIAFLVLLILKLLLGMLLLKYARNRYVKMKHKEQLVARGAAAPESYDALGRRVGGRGEVEVSDDKQRWIHADKTEGLRGGKGPGGKRPAGGGADDKGKKQEGEYQGVFRYEMVAKRIW